MDKFDVIVVGNGMVGHRFVELVIEHNNSKENGKKISLLTFSEESFLAYDRVQLSSYFLDADQTKLMLTDKKNYEDNDVEFKLREKVISIDRINKTVTTDQSNQYAYGSLVLATGSYPFVPPIPGRDQQHIHVYRTVQDLKDIEASASKSKTGVVIGGGLLGLEAANALKTLKLNTHVVEFAAQLMPVQLDKTAGRYLKEKIEALGLQVHLKKNTKSIEPGENARYKMLFADGSELETDLIVFSAGIRPQDELASSADLRLGERGGIEIDNFCLTSDRDIYAIGECALWDNKIFGLVAPGYQMAKVAAAHLKRKFTSQSSLSNQHPIEFEGADMSTKLKLLGVDVASIGDAHGKTDGAQSYSFRDEADRIYKKIVVSEDSNYLIGAVLVGDTEDYGNWLQLYLNKVELNGSPESLLFPASENSGDSIGGVEALPSTAQICSCNDVSKGEIISSISEGNHDLSSLQNACNAGTGCGGCNQLVKQVLDSELLKLGHAVNNDLCEHFAYTRRELFDIIRSTNTRTFREIIKSHGTGYGCEVCKPAIASILASLWNDPILNKEHVSLQDTNDAFLANMQKDGTYSIVPRVPGGEITPEKLIVIGQVAKDFSLYTKITGGQRIDLFGAQLHQLPIIWKRLIDAGFETGHAYGKSLRTVKSCVGNTWCRFGVQDSTSMAIYLEERYRGIRSPHKIKMAVSGCTRECAEAQSKDFGVIATEKGWNLYVGGNGGMRPRHAELFATDLDSKTLVQYIDRIMIFYIRTAEKLQRTSVWMENLDGGLDYLKSVIVEDKLAINEELENQMAHLVGTYQCEWKTTIEDPVKLKRFKHFVNSDKSDQKVKFIQQRGQIRPAKPAERIDIVEEATTL